MYCIIVTAKWRVDKILVTFTLFSRSPSFKAFSELYRLSQWVDFQQQQQNNVHTVSHFSYAPLFQGPQIFDKKCWNRTFSMIIYFLTFYLFDNIEKKYLNHSCESFCYSKAILTNFEKCTCKRNVYIFYFCFVLGIIHGDRCGRKTPKTIY